MVDEFSALLAYGGATRSGELNEVVGQSCRPLRRQARRSNNRFEILLRSSRAMLDMEQMRRVFVNLIDNALDALLRLAVRRG